MAASVSPFLRTRDVLGSGFNIFGPVIAAFLCLFARSDAKPVGFVSKAELFRLRADGARDASAVVMSVVDGGEGGAADAAAC